MWPSLATGWGPLSFCGASLIHHKCKKSFFYRQSILFISFPFPATTVQWWFNVEVQQWPTIYLGRPHWSLSYFSWTRSFWKSPQNISHVQCLGFPKRLKQARVWMWTAQMGPVLNFRVKYFLDASLKGPWARAEGPRAAVACCPGSSRAVNTATTLHILFPSRGCPPFFYTQGGTVCPK